MYNLNDCLDWMLEIQHYLDDRMDVVDGEDGQPRPSKAMSLHTDSEQVYKYLLRLKHEGVK